MKRRSFLSLIGVAPAAAVANEAAKKIEKAQEAIYVSRKAEIKPAVHSEIACTMAASWCGSITFSGALEES